MIFSLPSVYFMILDQIFLYSSELWNWSTTTGITFVFTIISIVHSLLLLQRLASTTTAITASPYPIALITSATPPITPRLWIWTCRKCKRKYPLSCTRKCLSCSHMVYFARRGSPEAKHCRLRFDYVGWQVYYNWRRKVQEENTLRSCKESRISPLVEPAESADADKSKETNNMRYLMGSGKHNCTVYCEFPGECFRDIIKYIRTHRIRRPAHAYKYRGQWLHKIKERPGEHHDISKPTADTSSPVAKQEGKRPEKKGKDSEQKENESEEEKKKSEEEKKETEEKEKEKKRERTYNNRLSRTKHYRFQKKPSPLNQVWGPQMDSETDGEKK